MISGSCNRSRQNPQRIGTKLVTAKRIVVDELQACHATVGPDIINVDSTGTLGETTCYTTLEAALEAVRDSEGGTVINMAPGAYVLPTYTEPLQNPLTFAGDDCPIVGVGYAHCARRNCAGVTFAHTVNPAIQGCGFTTLSVSGNSITVSMGAGGATSPDFDACADLVGHTVAIHSIPSGPGSGVISNHTITAASGSTITVSGTNPISGSPLAGEGFVVLPNVTITGGTGTTIKGMDSVNFKGLYFQIPLLFTVFPYHSTYDRVVNAPGGNLFVGWSAQGNASTNLGVFNFSAGSTCVWVWGANFGASAEKFTETNLVLDIFGVSAGSVRPLRIRNGDVVCVSSSDWFNCTTGPSVKGNSTVNIQNNFAKDCDTGFEAAHGGALVVRGLEDLGPLGFASLPASTVGCGVGYSLSYSSILDFPTFAATGGASPGFDLPISDLNTVTLSVDHTPQNSGFEGSMTGAGSWLDDGRYYAPLLGGGDAIAAGLTIPAYSHVNLDLA